MQGKRILLGISGGIAAYKTTFLIRLLKKSGAEVKCVMTPSAQDFVSPLVLSTLSGNAVNIDFWNKSNGLWINHVELAMWADVFVIAPATLNTISKMANGIGDNLLLTTYYSMKVKTIIAPAMDLDMYQHPTFKRNIKQLMTDGVDVIPSTEGELASGLFGQGRMEEAEEIHNHLSSYFKNQPKIQSKNKVLITAGPTYEKIDPVRFIGNYSSGKMGFELAKKFLFNGHDVCLITGPTPLQLIHPNLDIHRVESADEMFECVQSKWNNHDIGVFAAAVADYRPKNIQSKKIKKKILDLTLDLVKNPDILKWASDHKSDFQKIVGFALETNNSVENALMKLKEKKLDAIILNTLENKGAGFQLDTNQITIISKNETLDTFPMKSKTEVAEDIVNHIYSKL